MTHATKNMMQETSSFPVKAKKLPAGLYLVATPIGNLGDITLRALETFMSVDVVLCEDTRVTGKLMQAYGFKKTLISYNDHTSDSKRASILERLATGKEAIALASDAGMPLISDPGYKLVRDCADLGVLVTSVPGANAPLTAMQLSGLPSDKFSFLGFLPPKSVARRKVLTEWRDVAGSLIMFETAPRLQKSLKDMWSVLGDRPAAVVREITKRFEEVRRDTLSHLCAYYDDNGPPKGEIVLVVEGSTDDANAFSEKDLSQELDAALETMRVKDAAAFVAEKTGRPKKELYDLALKIKEQKG